MFNNATVTISRRGETQDPTTGYRTEGTGRMIIRDVPCYFGNTRNARSRFADGMREYVKATPSVIVADPLCVEVRPGDQATVTYQAGKQSFSQDFTVNDAIPAPGIAETHWEIDLERLK